VTLTVRQRVQETPDTATLFFEPTADIPPYLAGQFLTLQPGQFPAVHPWLVYLEHIKKKKELPRAYSLSSAPHEPYVAMTVKQEPYFPGNQPYPPLVSPYLVHGIAPGTPLKAVCFSGPYVLPPDIEEKTERVVHIVAGSGAVPNFSILKESLHSHPKLKHTFICSNKTWADICFREALAGLEKAHPDRLTVIHALTREPDLSHFTPPSKETSGGTGPPSKASSPRVIEGRVTHALLQELVPEPTRAFFYLCGPAITSHDRRVQLESGTPAEPRFLERMLDFLEQLGVPKTQVKREAYG